MILPVALSIPHCGTEIPPDIQQDLALSPDEIAESEDLGTREVFTGMPVLATQVARWSRLVVDLNRSADDLSPKGVIARKDYFGRKVFKPGFEPNQQESRRRVQLFHQPFHEKLIENLANPAIRLLLDCHSMDAVGPADAPDPEQRRAHISLGNNGGLDGGEAGSPSGQTTCPAGLLRDFASALESQGLSVSLNRPYSGGFITRHYGAILRKQGKSAMQIELNKDLVLSSEGELDPQKAGETSRALLVALKSLRSLL
jgi:N-formylglutamate deformylase